ncbi:MAG: AI-2E family transporter [Clostridia bacterium]|nr:AI-2E family transporter [Clostridia bacterium]
MKNKQGIQRWLFYFSLVTAAILVFKLSGSLPQLFAALGKLVGILSPFVIGLALALLLYRPCRFVERLLSRPKGKIWKKLARPLSLTAVYVLLLGLLALLVYLILPQVIVSLGDLFRALPTYIKNALHQVEEFCQPGGLLERFGLEDKLTEMYQALLDMVQKVLTTENLLAALRGVVSVTTSLFDVVIAVIVSLYMLAGRERLLREARAVLGLFMKEKSVECLRHYSRRAADIFYNYLCGALLDALVVGVVVSIGLLIFRIPYAVLLGLLLGLLNMIPYFGAIVGCIGVVLVTLLSKNIYAAIGVLICVVVVQQLDANILQPRVVGNSVGIRPIYVLLSITLFGGLCGFWGIFFGVPLMAVAQMLVKDAIVRRRQKTAEADMDESE